MNPTTAMRPMNKETHIDPEGLNLPDIEIYKDFEENSPYQKDIVEKVSKGLIKRHYQDPPELIIETKSSRVIHKFLPE